MTINDTNWYLISDTHLIDSPALVVYTDRVQQNIRQLITMVDDIQRLRTHAKTHKSREAALLQLKAGIRKFKCATIAEAEILAQTGAPDVLLAYQPLGPKQQRLFTLIDKYPDTLFSCLIDNQETALELSGHFLSSGRVLPVYIDLNIGQNRTGIGPEKALELYEAVLAMPGIELKGLHAYDGHIHHQDIEARTLLVEAGWAAVEKLVTEIAAKKLPRPVIIAGGSPSFPVHAKRKEVECSPGTFIFWDKGYSDECPEQPFLPAALLITRVVSMPGSTRLCLDLGHKSVAAENELQKRVFFINAPELKAVSQSEEHLVVEAGEGHHYKIGDVLYGMPQHICPTVALYDKAITIENGKVSGEWRIAARDRSITV